MSKAVSRMRLYTQADFKAAGKLDRILMSEMQPNIFALSDYEDKYLHILRQAFALCGDELNENVAISKIRATIVGYENYTVAAKLLNDVQLYWRNFIQKNKDYKLALVVVRMYALAEKAKEAAVTIDDFDTASRMLERAARLEGLDKIQQGLNAADIQIGDVIITSDIKALEMEEKRDDE